MVEFGTPNCGLFQRLKASARNWKYFVSEIGRFLNREVSQVETPGFLGPGVGPHVPKVYCGAAA